MKRLSIIVAAAALAVVAACSDSTSPSGSVTGRYVLRTVNGSTLPYSIGYDQTTGDQVDIIADTLWLNGSGNYNETFYYQYTGSSGVSVQPQYEVGTWSSTNGSINFYDQTDGGVQYQGSVSGSTLTEIAQGYTQVYAKQ